jgi:hypothetical protein
MAARKTPAATTKAAAKKTPGKSLRNWEAELAAKADIAVSTEANVGAGGKYFSLKSGQLSFNDAPVPGNEMTVVILDHVMEVTYYDTDYDADEVTPPAAYAIARTEDELVWHEDSIPEYAGEKVKGSDIFEWGSADKGKGKAAKEKRRIAIIAEGDLDDIANAEVAFLKIPTTSIKGYAQYVKNLNDTLKRPPLGVLTRIKVVPDAKTQFKVLFTMVEQITDGDVIGELLDKQPSVQEQLFAGYQKADEDEKPARGRNARGGKGVGKVAKAPAKKAVARRR